mmetsp:Transcript_72777/g.155871  ORF Transcript_72777/g.155871 Transcript_72777/m.155871 type:complete len:202 (+) Transcript_72777:47-652(+)
MFRSIFCVALAFCVATSVSSLRIPHEESLMYTFESNSQKEALFKAMVEHDKYNTSCGAFTTAMIDTPGDACFSNSGDHYGVGCVRHFEKAQTVTGPIFMEQFVGPVFLEQVTECNSSAFAMGYRFIEPSPLTALHAHGRFQIRDRPGGGSILDWTFWWQSVIPIPQILQTVVATDLYSRICKNAELRANDALDTCSEKPLR